MASRPHPRPPRTIALTLGLALLTACTPLALFAQATVTWDGSTDMTWSQPDTTSWGGDTYVSGNTAQFLGAGAGTVTIQPAGVEPGAIIVNSTNDYTFSGGPISGATSLSKSGAGTLSLTSANSFTGGVSVLDGTLQINAPDALPTAGTHTVNTGATLQLNSAGTNTYSQTLAGTGRVLLNMTSSGNTYLTGAGGFTGTLEISGDAGNKLTSTGLNISPTALIQINSGGQLYKTGSNTLSNPISVIGTGNTESRGAIRIDQGTLSGPISVMGNTTVGISGSGTLAGTISTGVGGTSTLRIGAPNENSPAANSFQGTISNGVGTLALEVLNNNSGNIFIPGSSLNTYSGGTTLLHGPGNGTRLVIGSISGTPYGSGPITIGQAATDKAGIYFTTANQTLASPIVMNTRLGSDRPGIRADTTNVTLSGQITANLADATFSTNGTGSFNLTGRITGAQGLRLHNQFGSSITVTLNNAAMNNNYQGDTTIEGTKGTLVLGAANQIPNGAGVGNLVNNGTFNMNGFSDTINGLSGAGTVNGGSGTPTLTLGDSNATSTFSGSIINTAGQLSLTKAGTGDLYLTGANSYSGTTTINAGRLVLGGSGTVGTGAVTVSSGAQLYLARNATITNAFTIAGNGNNGLDTAPRGALRIESGGTIAGTVTLAAASSIGSYSGNTGTVSANITGAFPLTINASASASPGRIIFSGTNSYTGGTTIANGTLQINAPSALPSTGTLTVNTGATLQLNGFSTTTGTLAVGANAIIENANATPATLTVGSASDSTIAGLLRDGTGGGALSLNKSGAGTLTLVNTQHTYSGTTTISQGTLRLGAADSNPVSSGLSWSLDAATGASINAGSPTSGDAVSTWTAATGPTVSQGTAANQPLWIAAAQNGLGVIRFDGTNDSLFSSSANAQVQTIFIVNDPNSLKSLAGIVGGNGLADTLGDRGIRGTGSSWQSPGNGNDFTNPAGSELRLNGILTNSHPPGFQTLTATRVGSAQAFNAVGSYFGGREFSGDIGEIVAFNRVLSPAESLLVEAYLAKKWFGATATNLLPTQTAVSIADGATLQFADATQTIGSLSGTSGAAVQLLGSSSLTTGTANSNTSFAGTISGTGTLSKAGTGTLTLSGANTYAGGTTVSGGTLLVNNTSGSGLGTGAVNVLSGATLGGAGIIGGPTLIHGGGFLSPGNSGGTITFADSLTLDPGATLFADLLFGGLDTDLVVVGGNVSVAGAQLAGTWGGSSANVFSDTFASDSMFWLIDNQGAGGIGGTFANSAISPGFSGLFGGVDPYLATIGGQLFALFYEADFNAGLDPATFTFSNLTSGNDLLLIAIPEPSRPLLLTIALAPLLLRRHRRRP